LTSLNSQTFSSFTTNQSVTSTETRTKVAELVLTKKEEQLGLALFKTQEVREEERRRKKERRKYKPIRSIDSDLPPRQPLEVGEITTNNSSANKEGVTSHISHVCVCEVEIIGLVEEVEVHILNTSSARRANESLANTSIGHSKYGSGIGERTGHQRITEGKQVLKSQEF
jgi:hypothetical protein